jgi:hypothetical protein
MEVEVASIVTQMMSAGERWESALDAHALAPPDAGFPMRLRVLSIAAGEQAAAFELAAQGGLGWRSRAIDSEFSLAPELTPGRTRPGPPELWHRFDVATAALAAALAGSSPKVLAESFTELSEVSGLLAIDLQRTYRAATRVAR